MIVLSLFTVLCLIVNYSLIKKDINNYYKYITPTYQSVYNYYYSNSKSIFINVIIIVDYVDILYMFLSDLHTNQTCKMGLFLLRYIINGFIYFL